MKKLLFFFITFNVVFAWCNMKESAYTHQRETFTNILYARQSGLMSEKAYKKFIEPYLQEAEQTLKTVMFFQQHPEYPQIIDYFRLIADLNVLYFGKELQSDVDATFLEQKLKNMIKKIKQKYNLSHINPEEELLKTGELLAKANKAYYQELPLLSKAKLFIAKTFFS